MNKPYELVKKFLELGENKPLLDKLQRRTQKEYLKKRLRIVELLWDRKTPKEIIEKINVRRTIIQQIMNQFVDKGVDEGLKHLAQPAKRSRDGKLSLDQQSSIISMICNESPRDYGYVQNTFTGKILVEIIYKKYGVSITDQTVYNMLKKQGFSYQKAHRDYELADPKQQHEYCESIKKNWRANKKPKK